MSVYGNVTRLSQLQMSHFSASWVQWELRGAFPETTMFTDHLLEGRV